MKPLQREHLKIWLIALLLVMNLVTVTTIWVLVSNKETALADAPTRPEGKPEAVTLLQEQLALSDEQAKQLELLRRDKVALMKQFNDSLSALKKQLAAELFKATPDSTRAAADAAAIGELQGKVEMLRFSHFNDLLALCTPEQKEKLKPVLMQLFGKKPPKDDAAPAGKRSKSAIETDAAPPAPDKQGGVAQNETTNNQKPKGATEKTEKLTRRLGLTPAQSRQVAAILTKTEERREELRRRVNPDKAVIEEEKEKIRQEEDAAISKLLDEGQRREFNKMQEKRKH